MNKTKIEWTDYTWNPIKGLCPVGCWYCYARAIYKRFRWDEKVRYVGPLVPRFPKTSSKIFICSTFELFHPSVKKEWRDLIFGAIRAFPRHTFQILTKMPENIDREMPDNVWLGVTLTGESFDKDLLKIRSFRSAEARVKFVSLEPLLGDISHLLYSDFGLGGINFNWLIIGRLTGFGKKHNPQVHMLDLAVERMKRWSVPIFLKDNLKEIWGDKLIQEFPE